MKILFSFFLIAFRNNKTKLISYFGFYFSFFAAIPFHSFPFLWYVTLGRLSKFCHRSSCTPWPNYCGFRRQISWFFFFLYFISSASRWVEQTEKCPWDTKDYCVTFAGLRINFARVSIFLLSSSCLYWARIFQVFFVMLKEIVMLMERDLNFQFYFYWEKSVI